MTIFSFMSQYRCSVYSVWKDGWLWKIDNDTTYDVGHQEVICEIFSQNISSAPHILGCFSPVCCPFSHKCAAQGIWILLSQCPASTSWRLTLLVLGYLGVSIIHRSPTKTTQFWTCVWGMFFIVYGGGLDLYQCTYWCVCVVLLGTVLCCTNKYVSCAFSKLEPITWKQRTRNQKVKTKSQANSKTNLHS